MESLIRFIRVLSVPAAISILIALLYMLAAPPRDLGKEDGDAGNP
jgi:hypothetical protein